MYRIDTLAIQIQQSSKITRIWLDMILKKRLSVVIDWQNSFVVSCQLNQCPQSDRGHPSALLAYFDEQNKIVLFG